MCLKYDPVLSSVNYDSTYNPKTYLEVTLSPTAPPCAEASSPLIRTSGPLVAHPPNLPMVRRKISDAVRGGSFCK